MNAPNGNNPGTQQRQSGNGPLGPRDGHAGPAAHVRHVLIVGEALTAELSPAIAQCAPQANIVSVPSILLAMGEAAHSPVDVLITPAEQLVGMAESSAHCLRELLPAARLVVLAEGEPHICDEAEAAVRGGFDVQLEEPVDEEALLAALGGRGKTDMSHDAASPSPPSSPPVEPATGGEQLEQDDASDSQTLPLTGVQFDSSTPHGAAALDGDKTQAGSSATPSDESTDSMLGDVDLVEALLGADSRLNTVAMQLMAQRSGINDLAWAQRVDDVPATHHRTPVHYHGRSFGYLHAPRPTSEAMLASWAGWLGRWLALHEHMRELEMLSMKDELTGSWNRRYFNRFLKRILEQGTQQRSHVTLLVFDIDDFKLYNDRYGHAAGDEILRETAKLMQSFVREHDVVARIGGDEFAVIFWDAEEKRRPDSAHPQDVRQAAERFQQAIYAHRFPKLLHEAPGTLTISGGLASFPWDGRTPEELLGRADAMTFQSKRQGKNAITFGPGALRACKVNRDD